MNNIQSTGEIDQLLWQCLDGTANDVQYREAWAWVNQSPQNKAYYSKMRDAWIASNLLQPVTSQQVEQNWKKLEKQILPKSKSVSQQHHPSLIPQWMKIAAMLVVVFGLGIAAHAWFSGPQPVVAVGTYYVEAPQGSKSQVMLADGTKVWLNAGSKISFEAGFNRQQRELSLQGEAYFEVAHDPGKPFLVNAAGITVRALGTAFNVKAYPDENIIETTLVNGSVRIEKKQQTGEVFKPVTLSPKQTVRFYKKEPEAASQPVVAKATGTVQPSPIEKIDIVDVANTEKYTSWKDKRWIFEGEEMGSFARKLERLYDVDIRFEDESLKKYKLSGTLEEESIEQLLEAIRLTIPMNYSIEKNRVYLKVDQKLSIEYEKLSQMK